MKKTIFTLIASAIFLMFSISVHAITLYDQDGSKVDLYSSLYIFYENTDEGRISGSGSRIGFEAFSEVRPSLTVFAHAEFRYDASQGREGVFYDSYSSLGITSRFGQLTFGNFDAVYYQSVSHLLDIYEDHEDAFFVAIGQDDIASYADSISYSTPEIFGLQVHGQARHYQRGETLSGSEELVLQFAAEYNLHQFSLGFATVPKNSKVEGFEESLFGLAAGYEFFDLLDLRILVEHLKDAGEEDYHAAFGMVLNYGRGEFYGSIGRDWNKDTYHGIGVNYDFNPAMRAFMEYSNGDSIDQDSIFVTGLRYDF